jgi:hypothetical protein
MMADGGITHPCTPPKRGNPKSIGEYCKGKDVDECRKYWEKL